MEIISPVEILIPKKEKEKIFQLLKYSPNESLDGQTRNYVFTKVDDWIFNSDYANELLTNQFGTLGLKGFGIDEMKEGIIAKE